MTQVFVPQSTVGVSLVLIIYIMHSSLTLLSMGPCGFAFEAGSVCLWLRWEWACGLPVQKRSKERCSVEALSLGSNLTLCSKHVSLVAGHFLMLWIMLGASVNLETLLEDSNSFPLQELKRSWTSQSTRPPNGPSNCTPISNGSLCASYLLSAILLKVYRTIPKNNTNIKIEWLHCCDLMGSSCRLSGVVSPCASCLRVSHGSPNFLVTTATGVFSNAFSTM